jgi:hypothetical protein
MNDPIADCSQLLNPFDELHGPGEHIAQRVEVYEIVVCCVADIRWKRIPKVVLHSLEWLLRNPEKWALVEYARHLIKSIGETPQSG